MTISEGEVEIMLQRVAGNKFRGRERAVVVNKAASKRNKFGAKRTVVDGISFASGAEAKRYRELKLMEGAGEIRHLALQPRFDFPIGVKFTPDFSYLDREGVRIVEEVKGVRTEAFELRLKLFHYFFQGQILLINGVNSRAPKPRKKRKVKA